MPIYVYNMQNTDTEFLEGWVLKSEDPWKTSHLIQLDYHYTRTTSSYYNNKNIRAIP